MKTILVAASVCAMALFVGAGAASADSGNVCGFGSSSGNVETCFSITGSGLFVNQMVVEATVINSGRKLQVCIHGPDPALPQCSPQQSVPAGGALTKAWNPNRNVNAGTYCGRTWRINSDGSYTLIGEECADVHS
jgi:hypothetical protein